MPHCTTNISLPYEGELITVTLSVEFEVAPADPSVGIMFDGIEEFTAKVIDSDEGTDTTSLSVFQDIYDELEEDYVDEIEEACIESLADVDEP